MNRGAILQRLRAFGGSGGGEWSTLDDLVAVQAFKPHQLDTIGEWSRTAGSTWPAVAVHHRIGRRRGCILRARRGSGENERAAQHQPGPTHTVHLVVSPLLSRSRTIS